MDDLAVEWDGYCLCRFDHSVDVFWSDFLALDRYDAVTVQTIDVTSGDSNEHRFDFASSHQLCFFNSASDRFHSSIDVNHHSFA